MNKVINVPASVFQGAKLPQAFQGVGGGEELGAGVQGGFGIVTFKGKVWRTKYRGEETVLLAADGRNPRPELEVIIVKAATNISKTYYKDAFVDGSVTPPDCFSVNGVVPDPASSDKQSATCAGCKQNAWGSRVTEAGKPAKACSDNKRLVIVPADDILNESLGGPMMLRVPPTTLQDMANFGNLMKSRGFPYYSFVTRLRFDPDEAYPKFIFEAVRPLNEDEAKLVMEMRASEITTRILSAPVVEVHHDADERKPAVSPEAEALFSAEAAQKLAVVQAEPVQESLTKDPAQPELPLNPAPKSESAAAARPKFDPMTGEKIVYPDEVVDTRPKFDPMTGERIVYDDAPKTQPAAPTKAKEEGQAFPDIPSGLVRDKKAKKVKEEPKPEDAKVGGSFEDALDGLLGTKK